jgi:transglutaminase-like putative cysteine protease
MRARLTVIAAVATLLSSIGLYPLFSGTGWLWAGLGAIIAVSSAGVLARRFRLPAVLNLAAGLAALHLYLTAVYTGSQAFLGIVPTPSSLSKIGSLMAAGWSAANKYAAPVPLEQGVSLLAALGIGLVAVIVDLLAVRLRRAAPAGLPLLAMYSVPAAVREESVSWIAFVLGAAGFLALLLADAGEQVTAWGRHVLAARWTEETPTATGGTGALAGAGRRLGLAAVAVAILLPTIIPGIHPRGIFGLGGPGDGPGGSGPLQTPDPLVTLHQQLIRQDNGMILTYRSDDPEPDYLRLYGLDKFDGDRWTYSTLPSTPQDRLKNHELPPPPGLYGVRTRTVRTTITISAQTAKVRFLPLPYAPTKVDISGDWRVHAPSLMVYSLNDQAGGRTFTVTSSRALPTGDDLVNAGPLPPEVQSTFLEVPRLLPEVVRTIASQVAGRATNPYRKAMALEKYFTGPLFRYSTTTPPPEKLNDLIHFLTVTRTGYCEQFAASMALMARILGIPARVAVGYTSGYRRTDGTWEVRSSDAHAWPELYFDGAGWVRFEPTPAGSGGQGSAWVPDYALQSTSGGTGHGGTGAPGSGSQHGPAGAITAGPHQGRAHDVGGLGPQAGNHPKGTGVPVGWLGAIGVLLVALAAPVGVRLASRRRRWAQAEHRSSRSAAGPPVHQGESAHAAWAELHADAVDHGLTWRPSDSPRAAAHRLTELLELTGPAAEALGRIAMAEERARYAPQPVHAGTLRTDVRTMREAFAASVDRQTRLRARVLPPSAMITLRSAGTRLLEAGEYLRLPKR